MRKFLKMPVWVKPSLWGAAVGAALWWIALAASFGWMSEGAAQQAAAQQAQEAVVAYATPACIARFEKQPDPVAAWKELKASSEWSRGDIVKKGGWTTEPGQELSSDVVDAIAKNCATQLSELKTLDGKILPTQ